MWTFSGNWVYIVSSFIESYDCNLSCFFEKLDGNITYVQISLGFVSTILGPGKNSTMWNLY